MGIIRLALTVLWTVAVTGLNEEEINELSLKFNIDETQFGLKPFKTTAERITEHGYPVETHPIVTEDGYILTLFRIPYSHNLQNQFEPRPIVLIQHGLFSSSDGWIVNGPDDALVFMLADAGYDVWIGNARGTTYSRNHTTLSANHPHFWHFSWHEIGYYDLPAMIDYALATNDQAQETLHYVGHSQGTTSFFILLSLRPEYNAKIKTAHMMAPVVFMKHSSDTLLKVLAPLLGHHNIFSVFFGNQEFVPHNDLLLLLDTNLCKANSSFFGLCPLLALVLEKDQTNFNLTALPYIVETHPAGASTNQLVHYLQEQQSGCFCQYDFGKRRNMQVYDQLSPPDYPLQAVTAEMHLWYGDNDAIASAVDVHRLSAILTNKVMHHMEDPTWTHGDFLFAMEVRKSLNEPILQIMQDYDGNNYI